MPKNQPEPTNNNFRVYWRHTDINKDFHVQEILYRIEDLIIYRIDLKRGVTTIIPNIGEAIPREAISITKETFEAQILRYML